MKKWCVSCLLVLAVLAAVPVYAAPDNASAFLSALAIEAAAPASCQAAPAVETPWQMTAPESGWLVDVGAPQPEACSPAECGSGVAHPQCGTSCCRAKCCIC